MSDMESEMDFKLVSSAAPVREQAVEKLQHLLISGRFAPGERLKERVLIDLLSTSRTTIREALRQLEADGLVTVVPGRGPVVATVTVQDVCEIYELRKVLELLAVRLFCERATDLQLRLLKAAFDTLRDAHQTALPQRILAAKQSFYDVLFSGTGNTLLGALVERLQVRICRVRIASLSQPGRIAVGVAELFPVVEAISRRDASAAEAAYQFHIDQARAAAVEAVEALQGKSATAASDAGPVSESGHPVAAWPI